MSTNATIYKEAWTLWVNPIPVHKVNLVFLQQCASVKCFMRTGELSYCCILL